MVAIKGIPVQLYEKTQTGVDGFGAPIYEETAVTVDNVLIYPASADDVKETLNILGKHAVYNLCIPKGDTREWTNARVEFYGKTWRTIGEPKVYIEAMVPLSWNKQISVERYE